MSNKIVVDAMVGSDLDINGNIICDIFTFGKNGVFETDKDAEVYCRNEGNWKNDKIHKAKVTIEFVKEME